MTVEKYTRDPRTALIQDKPAAALPQATQRCETAPASIRPVAPGEGADPHPSPRTSGSPPSP